MPTTNLTIIIFSNNVNNKYNLRPLVINKFSSKFIICTRPFENHFCERLPCLKMFNNNNNNNNEFVIRHFCVAVRFRNYFKFLEV